MDYVRLYFENTPSECVEAALVAAAGAAIRPDMVENLYANCGYKYSNSEARACAIHNWANLELYRQGLLRIERL